MTWTDVSLTEAKALLYGIHMGQQVGFEHVILESDSLKGVNGCSRSVGQRTVISRTSSKSSVFVALIA